MNAIEADAGSFKHYYYVRKHADRVVFVANVYTGQSKDVDAIEACLRDSFSAVGDIENVELLRARKTVAARVTFATDVEARRCVDRKTLDLDVSTFEHPSLADVIARHVAECESIEEHDRLCEAALVAFENEREAEDARRRARSDEPDEDGFVTVTYKRKAVGKAPRVSSSAKRKSKAPADDFYRFQRREVKRSKLAGLRQEIDDNKARIAKLRAGAKRKFKT